MSAPTLTLSDAANALGARRIGPDTAISGCAIDSRAARPGQLFVALHGERADGHDYVTAARKLGAAAALVERVVDCTMPSLVVPDTRAALGRLAGYWRNRLSATVVGVTGSNGKTTVKELIGAIVRHAGPAQVTAGNLNNDIGLPMTLLAMTPEQRFGVVEMGANHAGEIAYLAALARPSIGVITHCGPAHLEGFGSIEGVARAKGELLGALPPDGCAVLNADDPWIGLWRTLAGDRRVVTFGLVHDADVSADWHTDADGIVLDVTTPSATFRARCRLLGRHNVMNVLAAVAAAHALGLNADLMTAGLADATPVPGRLCPRATAPGAALIDDTYNANPASLDAALDVLATTGGEHWVVLGDMAELGPSTVQMHADAGRAIHASGVSRLFTLGPLSAHTSAAFGDGAEHFETLDALVARLRDALGDGQTLLVKGSRSMAMERVVQALAIQG